MVEPKEEEVLSVEDESDDFYTKAYQAFKQARDMPNRLRISDYALRYRPAVYDPPNRRQLLPWP